MKKIIGILVLSLSFSVHAQESLVAGEPMSFDEFQEAYTFYYNACMDANGNIEDPVILD